MALDLGELSGRIALDINPARKGVADIKGELGAIKPAAAQAGGEAGTAMGEEFGSKGKAAVTAATAGIVVALGAGIAETMDREAVGDKLAAQLGLGERQAERTGRIAGRIYGRAYGESLGEVNNALGAVMTSFDDMESSSNKKLRGLTVQALDYATAFEVDVARGIQVAGQLVTSGLAANAGEAFDLITAGSQRVPAAVREDLLDAADEYGQFFAQLGYDGPAAFALLVDASEKGMYGIDKAGDAIKEFTIRSTDMSTATRDAYRMIGLDARDMTNEILAGGDRAQGATQKVIDGILGIEDPAKQGVAALALFGTPLEDLSVGEIPDFVRSLRDGSDAMKGFEGSTRDMGKTLNDNASARVTAFKRQMQGEFIDFLDAEAIPFLENEVFPAIEGIGDALSSVPSWAIKGTVGGFLGLVAAGKLGSLAGDLRGLRGGGGGLAGTVASKASPVPVLVVNDMPGAAGGTAAGGTKPRSSLAAGALTVGGTLVGAEAVRQGLQSDGGPLDNPAARAAARTSSAGGIGAFLAYNPDDHVKKLESSFGEMVANARDGVQDVMKAYETLPAELITDFKTDGIPESRGQARDLVKQYDLTPKEKRTLFELLGYETTASRAREIDRLLDQAAEDRYSRITVTRTINNLGHETRGGLQERASGGTVARGRPYLVGEREPEVFVPNESGRIYNQQQLRGARSTGPARTSEAVTIVIPGMGELVGTMIREGIEGHDQWLEDVS